MKEAIFLWAIDIFSKYAWIVPLKGKKDITITWAFQKTLEESNHKPNKIWVDKAMNFNWPTISWIFTMINEIMFKG